MPILPTNAVTKILKTFDLRSPQAIAKDSGTITGALTFTQEGADFDGSNDYITYAISSTFFQSKPKISITVEFTPDFASTDSASHTICDATNGARYLLLKDNDNKLYCFLGDTNVAAIANVTFASYWLTGKRNVLTVSSTTGATNVWLNGVQILTNGATAWTVGSPASFYAGCKYDGNNKFDGRIHSISIKNDLTTAQEALDLYNNSTFNFQNKADVWLDMKSQSSDGTNAITLDKSGNGNDFKLGDGTTAAWKPTFLNPGFRIITGLEFFYNNTTASNIFNNTYQSIVFCFKPNFKVSDNITGVLLDSEGSTKRHVIAKQPNGGSNILDIFLGGTQLTSVPQATYEPYWKYNGVNVLVVTGTTGNTDAYLNGFKILNAASTAWTPSSPSFIVLMNLNSPSSTYDFPGNIYHFSTYGKKFSQKMTPTQIRAITSYLLNEYK